MGKNLSSLSIWLDASVHCLSQESSSCTECSSGGGSTHAVHITKLWLAHCSPDSDHHMFEALQLGSKHIANVQKVRSPWR